LEQEIRRHNKYHRTYCKMGSWKKGKKERCSAQTQTRIGLLEEIPRSGVQIIITTSTLDLGFKTFAPKILAHTKCINRY
jgi:hypothetical protein